MKTTRVIDLINRGVELQWSHYAGDGALRPPERLSRYCYVRIRTH